MNPEPKFEVDCDPARLDLDLIHQVLVESYWARGIPREVLRRSIEHSLNFGLYRGAEQVGFARCVTDRATFAYLADVFVLEDYRGRGLGKRLLESALAHPELQGLRRWMLATRDAHGLYRSFGFGELDDAAMLMQIRDPEAYN